MKLNQLQQLVNKLNECDEFYERLANMGISFPMRDAMQGAVIERKNNLLEQLRAVGIEVEV